MTWKDFWFNTNNPKLDDYLYKPRHVLCLIFVLVLTIYLLINYKKKNFVKKNKLLKIFAYIFLFFELSSRVVSLIVTSDYSIANIIKILVPMHICAIMVWVLIISIFFELKTLKEFASIGGLLSTLAFLLYPAVGLNRVYMTFTQLYSVSTHMLGFACSIIILSIDEEVKFNYKTFLKVLVCFIVMFAYGYILDYYLFPGSDYMYLREDPLNLNLPINYRIIYGIILLLYINLFYLIPFIKSKIEERNINKMIIQNSKPNLIVVCGLPGSGKEKKANYFAKKYNNYYKLSIKGYRSIYNNMEYKNLIRIISDDINKHLENKCNIILNMIGVTSKERINLLKSLKYDCYKICYIMNTPYEVCLKNLKGDNSDLDFYYKSFQIPFYEEGWDDINVNKKIKYNESQDCSLSQDEYISDYVGLELCNYTSDINLITSGSIYEQCEIDYRDKKFKNYSCNTGTYDCLSTSGVWNLNKNNYNIYNTFDTLETLFYINYRKYIKNRSEKKCIKLFGEYKYNNLILLNNIIEQEENRFNG